MVGGVLVNARTPSFLLVRWQTWLGVICWRGVNLISPAAAAKHPAKETVVNKLIGVLVLFVWSLQVQAEIAPEACKDGKCIQIGTYNIEYLGGTRDAYDGTPRGDRTDEQIQLLADRLTDTLDLEIVVFEEINTHSDQWKKLKEKLAAKGFKFFEGTSSERNQFVVLAWDADDVSLVDNSARELDVRNNFELGDGCVIKNLRKPVIGRFKAGEFDFWVVGVHLKSRKGVESCNDKVRTEQCKDLVEKTNALVKESGERDIIIVGDCNNRLGHESFKPLGDAGFTAQMKFLMPQSAKGSFVKTKDLDKTRDLIDQVFIRYNDTKEVVKSSACVLKLESPEETAKYIIEQSDHAPAWVSFRTDKDLDGSN